MEPHGFIRSMMDVKVLILFVTARCSYPVSLQQLYELCYQDDCLSYFDLCTAVPEMVCSGHLAESSGGIEITEKGRADGAVTEDSIAYSVKQRAEAAVQRFNRNMQRENFVKTQVTPRRSGDYSLILSLDDEQGNLMTLELMAPNQKQAVSLSNAFRKKAELLYNLVMSELLDDISDA